MEYKKCNVCDENKSEDDFSVYSNTKKLRGYCKLCEKEKRKGRDAKYRLENSESMNESSKKYRLNNLEKVKVREKKYRLKNKESIRIKNLLWRRKTAKQPFYITKRNVSKTIQKSFKRNGYTKKSKTHEILGCSYEDFKKHIESQWEEWMNWDNYGNPKDGILEPYKTWDLDHIIPLASAINENDIIKLNHYTNFQPLCSYINRLIKKDKLI